jgi:Galactose oxidase, central domain/Kelch motif
MKKKAHLVRGAFYVLLLPLVAVYEIELALGQWQAATSPSSKNPTGGICFPPAWTAGPDMPSTGVRMVGVYFSANGKFYTMGGRSMDGVGNDFTHPFEYDPGSNSWTIKSASYPDNQVSNMACGVMTDSGTDYIYCIGGSAGGQTTATDRVFRYDPLTDIIESLASPWPGDNDGITLPGGFAVFDNKLYILGGFRINTAMINTIWEFNPGTNTWIQKAGTLPVARGYIPTVTYLNFIYTAGGSDWDGTTLVDTNDSFTYDPVTDSITAVPNIPRITAETRALKFADGSVAGCAPSIWVMGGGRTPPNPSNEVDVTCGGGWAIGPPFVTARRNFPTDTDVGQINFGTGHIWLAGGYGSDGVTPLRSMEIYCSSVPTPSEPPPMTPTATATATPTAPSPSPAPTPTLPPSPTPTPTQRATPLPRLRPTPPLRP